MKINEMLKTAEKLYDEETSKIGHAIRVNLLIPFCNKHQMAFNTGMGCWSLENNMINIYGYQDDYWEAKKEYLSTAKDDDEYDVLMEKVKAFRNLPETKKLVEALDARDMRGASIGCNMDSYTPKGKHTCVCEGTGLIPPTSKLSNREHQVYCPTHKCTRTWPQIQTDGNISYKELRINNQGLK